MNQFQPANQAYQQLAHAEQLIQQLVNQTQQASVQYQQLLHQEKNNAVQLEQIAQREHQAASIIQTALQGHQTAIQQLQQINAICQQISRTASSSYNTNNINNIPVYSQSGNQSQLHSNSFTSYSN